MAQVRSGNVQIAVSVWSNEESACPRLKEAGYDRHAPSRNPQPNERSDGQIGGGTRFQGPRFLVSLQIGVIDHFWSPSLPAARPTLRQPSLMIRCTTAQHDPNEAT